MIYIIKQEGLYQNKVNSSLVFTCNCKMGFCFLDDHIVYNHQVGFRAKKEKAQEAYPSLAGACSVEYGACRHDGK